MSSEKALGEDKRKQVVTRRGKKPRFFIFIAILLISFSFTGESPWDSILLSHEKKLLYKHHIIVYMNNKE